MIQNKKKVNFCIWKKILGDNLLKEKQQENKNRKVMENMNKMWLWKRMKMKFKAKEETQKVHNIEEAKKMK